MFVAGVSKLHLVHSDSVFAFGPFLFQRMFHKRKHSPVVRASQRPDCRFLRPLPALLPKLFIRHIHHAHFPLDKRFAELFKGFAVPMNRHRQRFNPNRFRPLQDLMPVRLSRNTFIRHIAKIIIILLLENAVRIMAVLLPSDHDSEFPDRFRNHNPSCFLRHFTLQCTFRRFPGLDSPARKLIAIELCHIIEQHFPVLQDDSPRRRPPVHFPFRVIVLPVHLKQFSHCRYHLHRQPVHIPDVPTAHKIQTCAGKRMTPDRLRIKGLEF